MQRYEETIKMLEAPKVAESNPLEQEAVAAVGEAAEGGASGGGVGGAG